MQLRGLGWLVIACAATRAASADPIAHVQPAVHAPPAKPARPSDLGRLTDPQLARADRIRGTEVENLVAFTFDDGPSPATTPAVIDALQRYDVPATFFILSQRIAGRSGARSRDVLARQIAAGFQIGSHSWSHPNLRGASQTRLAKEIDAAVRELAKRAGRPIGIFRAPYGALDRASRAWLRRRGLTEAFWSVDTLDWKAHDAARLRKKVMAMILRQHGGVVLMHDVKPITAQIIAGILDDLEAENCKRLGAKQAPILPVSLHYFLRDRRKPRAIPDEVKKRTEAYRSALPGRCAKRPSPSVTTPVPPPPAGALTRIGLPPPPAAPPAVPPPPVTGTSPAGA